MKVLPPVPRMKAPPAPPQGRWSTKHVKNYMQRHGRDAKFIVQKIKDLEHAKCPSAGLLQEAMLGFLRKQASAGTPEAMKALKLLNIHHHGHIHHHRQVKKEVKQQAIDAVIDAAEGIAQELLAQVQKRRSAV